MKYLIYLSVLLFGVSGFAQVSSDVSAVSSDVSSNEIQVTGNDNFDVVVSDKNTTDMTDFYGPYSFSSLPKDVRDRLVNGLDDNGNQTVTEMLRRASEEAQPDGEAQQPAARRNSFNFGNTHSTGDSVAQFVRRVRGQSEGLSVRLKNNNLKKNDGTSVRNREFWIYYKAKFD